MVISVESYNRDVTTIDPHKTMWILFQHYYSLNHFFIVNDKIGSISIQINFGWNKFNKKLIFYKIQDKTMLIQPLCHIPYTET